MLRLMVNETASTLRCAFHPLERIRSISPNGQPEKLPELLIVHGFMGRPNMFIPMARYLMNQGVPAVHFAKYSSWKVTIDDIIDHLEELVTTNEIKECNLIGHSLGAVAIRAWIKERNTCPKHKHFIALGAPFKGTEWHNVVPRKLRPIFDPRSERVQRINALPEPETLTVIRARHDQNVRPSSHASIEGIPEIILEHVGHNGLINHPSAIRTTWQILSQ